MTSPCAAEPAGATEPTEPRSSSWKRAVLRHKRPVLSRSLTQIATSILPYLALCVAMAFAYRISPWLVLPLAPIAAGFLVRTFIIFHDCTHGSFFRSRRWNDLLGFATGVLTFTPYHQWRREHALHHATAGDLDRRGVGDVWTLTVEEYLASSRMRRLGYRLVRNPAILFVVAPFWLFVVRYRFPVPSASRAERRWVWGTNAAILAVAAGASAAIGIPAYLFIQFAILVVSSAAGVWLFYVQHQFEGVYWQRREEWDFVEAALAGSSYYRLPRVLQWFSGNIGFHHLHHLSPAIPNYNLEECHGAHPDFRSVPAVTLRSSLRCLSFRLWDESRRRLISFRELRRLRRAGLAGESS